MASLFWCYQCNRLVNVSDETSLVCPLCTTGFLVARVHREGPTSAPVSPPESPRSPLGFRRSRRRSTSNSVPTSLYNPIILMRTPPETPGGDVSLVGTDVNGERLFRLYYDHEGGGGMSGLRPLPPTMAEFLLGPGFDRLLDQLSQLEVNRPGNSNAPACKAAIESMPVVEIEPSHVCDELSCSVCHEEFEVGSEAREMPCKHLYHSECIIPWLAIRNSCPICRHELPGETENEPAPDHQPFAITIWRLPSGGYAVGQFAGSSNALPRTIASVSRSGGSMRRLFGGFVSFCKRVMSSSVRVSSSSEPGSPENLVPTNRSMSIS